LKVLVVIDNGTFFYNTFASYIIKNLKYKKIHFAVVTHIKKSNSLNEYLMKHFYFLTFIEVIKLFYNVIKNKINSLFFFNEHDDSLIQNLKKNNISYFKIKFDINKKKYEAQIKKIKPDLIICSSSVILKKNILKIPKFGCINRHSSLLPLNAGILPIFYAICQKRKFSGFTIHLMNEKIDKGKILYQKKIKIIDKNMFLTYKKIFLESAKYLNISIQNLQNKKFVKSPYPPTYNSFPSSYDWRIFRKNFGKFI
tara:strand:+ start:1122 stop:1883 length:762 start_codon:yes stop_codon:yes gene_type:complete